MEQALHPYFFFGLGELNTLTMKASERMGKVSFIPFSESWKHRVRMRRSASGIKRCLSHSFNQHSYEVQKGFQRK